MWCQELEQQGARPLRGKGCQWRCSPLQKRPCGPTAWVVELRALLRDYPIDRTSLPAPIENLRRAELVEALRQIGAMGYGGQP